VAPRKTRRVVMTRLARGVRKESVGGIFPREALAGKIRESLLAYDNLSCLRTRPSENSRLPGEGTLGVRSCGQTILTVFWMRGTSRVRGHP
jgi:hypothetical protein